MPIMSNKGSGFGKIDKIFGDFGMVLVSPSYMGWGGLTIRLMLQPHLDPKVADDLIDDNAIRIAMYDEIERAVKAAQENFEVTDISLNIQCKPYSRDVPLMIEGWLELTINAKEATPR